MKIITPTDERFPLLKATSQPCALPPSQEDYQVVHDLIEVLNEIGDTAVGLSAVQVGITKRIFVVRGNSNEDQTEFLGFINPMVMSRSKETNRKTESCLSLPQVSVRIDRPKSLVLQYCNVDGQPCTEEFSGPIARIICHEMDHLNGVLITDHLEKQMEKHARLQNEKLALRKKRAQARRKKRKLSRRR